MKRLRKNDLVVVIAGKNLGKTGRVKRLVGEDRVIVENINKVKIHKKAKQDSPAGIEETESAIHISNVMHVDPKTKERCRVRFQGKGREKVRISVKSNEVVS